MKRKVYDELLKWKENAIESPLMIIGARQVGKTYIIKEFCKKEFERYVYIDLLEDENIVELFKRPISLTEKMSLLKAIIKNTKNINIDYSSDVLVIDEIQESEELISSLKQLKESDIPYKILCAGSLLGVKLKRMSKPFPVGKSEMIYMYPMDFEEFLWETMGKEIVDMIYEHAKTNEPLVDTIHEELLSLYRLYLCVGGMPECVDNILKMNKDVVSFDKKIPKKITEGYAKDMSRYVKDETETIRIEKLYKSIPSQIGNKANKFQYAKIDRNARKTNYETALSWLESSMIVTKVCYINPSEIPPEVYKDEDVFKLYVSDVGLLNSLAFMNLSDIILDNGFVFKGNITENYVCNQLKINFENLYYWKSDNLSEVDFIIYNNDGVIPIEVKAGNKVQSKSLNIYIEKYKPKYAIRLSAKNFGYDNNIKSVPLYAAFTIR